MLLTITTTYQPATDLGYLLYKHPARVQTFDLNFGKAHVFYPEATPERCTAALLLDIDPVGLLRGGGADSWGVEQYVNDRPYSDQVRLCRCVLLAARVAEYPKTVRAFSRGTPQDRACF